MIVYMGKTCRFCGDKSLVFVFPFDDPTVVVRIVLSSFEQPEQALLEFDDGLRECNCFFFIFSVFFFFIWILILISIFFLADDPFSSATKSLVIREQDSGIVECKIVFLNFILF